MGQKTLACYKDEKWTTYPLPQAVGRGSSWDPIANELYIQVRLTHGSQVVDLGTHEVVRTLEVPELEGVSSFHEYWDGYVYTGSSGNVGNINLYRIDSQTGKTENTGIIVDSGFAVGVLRDVENIIYIGGTLITGLRIDRYDPETGMLLDDPILSSPDKGFRLEFQRRAGL